MGVPKWEQLRLADLFRFGPWEIVLFFWILGGVSVYTLLISPLFRIISVTDPVLAGLVGGMLAGLLAAQAVIRRYSSSKSFQARLCVIGALALGALALTLCARGPFQPTVLQASTCAPPVAVHESEAGYWASWVLPPLLWFAWGGYLLSGFPAIRRFDDMHLHSVGSRYQHYERALRAFPFRVIWLFAIITAIWFYGSNEYAIIQKDSSIQQILDALSVLPPTAFPQAGQPEVLFGKIEEAREGVEHEAMAALDAMEFDRARPLVKRAACDLVLPTFNPSKEILTMEANFRTLERELGSTEGWTPSSAVVKAILNLTPINKPGSTKPICPLFWLSQKTAVSTTVLREEIKTATRTITYKGRQLLDIRLSSIPLEDAHPVTLEVAIRVSGTAGDNGELASLLEARLGQKPTDGPQSIGTGAICAHWNLGQVGIRLGPAVAPQIPESSMNPASPLWITCYDHSLKGALELIYQSPDGKRSWDPHGCGLLYPTVLTLPVK